MHKTLMIGFKEMSRNEEYEITGGKVDWIKVAEIVTDVLAGGPGNKMLIDIVANDLARCYVSGLYEGFYYY